MKDVIYSSLSECLSQLLAWRMWGLCIPEKLHATSLFFRILLRSATRKPRRYKRFHRPSFVSHL